MPAGHEDTVRRIYALLTEGDGGAMDLAAPGFVVDFSRRLFDPFILDGREDARAYFCESTEWRDAWDGFPVWEPLEFIDAGDRLFATIRFAGRGTASGVEIETRVTHVWAFENGAPVRLTYFGEDRAAALAAAGIS